MKKLKNEILEVKREKEREIQERSEMIAHLKDQLQELKGMWPYVGSLKLRQQLNGK